MTFLDFDLNDAVEVHIDKHMYLYKDKDGYLWSINKTKTQEVKFRDKWTKYGVMKEIESLEDLHIRLGIKVFNYSMTLRGFSTIQDNFSYQKGLIIRWQNDLTYSMVRTNEEPFRYYTVSLTMRDDGSLYVSLAEPIAAMHK